MSSEMIREPYRMEFDIGTVKHLGLHMYSTLPPVIGELVANGWDADAKRVEITIPEGTMTETSEIVVSDDGNGMSDTLVREAYMIVGRDRREDEGTDETPGGRPIMGRKGIGKFCGFGIAEEIEVESVQADETSRFMMNYQALKDAASKRVIEFPPLDPSGNVQEGTLVTLRGIKKYRSRSISIPQLRRGLARRFSVIGQEWDFEIIVNGEPITADERDLQRLLGLDSDGNPYLWKYQDVEIESGSGWTVSGWIGALDRTSELEDGIQRGIVVMARGKLVQEPFVFDATVGQQYALSYLVGELHAEFVDAAEDTIATTRNSLVWDSEANAAFKTWGQHEVNKIARQWAEKRQADNEVTLNLNPRYTKFKEEAAEIGNLRAIKVADRLVREVIKKDVVGSESSQEDVIELATDFLRFDAFWDLAEEVVDADIEKPARLMQLFREWEMVEAREMARVTNGRIKTIEKLQALIDSDALEVPTLHNFLKEFPWVLDPRWNLIADEQTYSELLRKKFPDQELPENDRRIDFLCVRESEQLVVVEIKRPGTKASLNELGQIESYVHFMRDYVSKTSDPDASTSEVVGYLLCGDLIDSGPNAGQVRQKCETLKNSKIYVRRYGELLAMVKNSHKEFLERYGQLQEASRSKLPSGEDSA
jgi:Histidine kinase-, DNA gyrase B-, and HSP90-like ATPase